MLKSKILTVDDRRVDRILYMELLGYDKYEFFELDDGEKVVPFLKENKDIDVILLDWQMPVIGGLEALKLVKADPDIAEIPVIIITGLEDEKVLEQAFDYGGVDFLQKPVMGVELMSRVDNVLKLSKAQKSLQYQKDQLEELNRIITVQKNELQSSIKIKEELAELKRIELETELDDKKRRLITMGVESSKIGKSMQGLTEILAKCVNQIKSENANSESLRGLKKLEKAMNDLISGEDNWSEFKKVFESTHPEFFSKLMRINPKLTSLDLKHCAYMKMNIDNYDLSNILGVEMKSIQMTRYRLKKKLNLDAEKSLREYVLSI